MQAGSRTGERENNDAMRRSLNGQGDLEKEASPEHHREPSDYLRMPQIAQREYTDSDAARS